MPLPKMTDEQRADALKKAAETRRARSEFRAKIKAGKITAKKALQAQRPDRRQDQSLAVHPVVPRLGQGEGREAHGRDRHR